MTKEQLEIYKNTYDCFDGISSNEFDVICDELIKYKQLEEELGCPLEVFITALFNGFYDEFGNHFKCDWFSNMFRRMMVTKDTFTKEFYLKDYKKTWWLKANRSE